MNLTLAIGYLMLFGLGTYLLARLIDWAEWVWRTRDRSVLGRPDPRKPPWRSPPAPAPYPAKIQAIEKGIRSRTFGKKNEGAIVLDSSDEHLGNRTLIDAMSIKQGGAG